MQHLRQCEQSPAYPVPWRVERDHESHPRMVNDGEEPADFVRVFRDAATTDRWSQLLPGDTVELCLCDVDLDEAVITVCWFRRQTGVEYAWRFVI